MSNDKVAFLGLDFSIFSLEKIVSRITEDYPLHGTAYHLVNAYTMVLADESPKLHRILELDFLLCDGKPLARLLQRKHSDLRQIRGADLMRRSLSNKSGINSHFFLGSTNETLEKLVRFAEKNNERIQIAGYHSPEFSDDYEKSLPVWVNMIRNSGASVIWVGLGTPKQDFVVHFLARHLPVHAIAIGAAFDFLSGNVSEAPRIVQKLNLEWLFRLVREPRRLARRYLIGNYRFIKLVKPSRGRGL